MSTQTKRSIQALFILLTGSATLIIGIYSIFHRFEVIELTASDLFQDYSSSQFALKHQSIYYNANSQNNHPPFTSILTIPLTLFNFQTASILWTILTLVLFLLSAWLIINELGLKIPNLYLPLFIGLALCWYPVQSHIALGQWSIQIGFLIILGWIFLRHEKQLPAGFFFGLAALIKLFPALIILYLLIKKRWLTLTSMLLTISLGIVIPIVLNGPRDTYIFITNIVSRNTFTYLAFPINFSILGILGKFFYNGPWVRPVWNLSIYITYITLVLDIGLILLLISFYLKKPSNLYNQDTNIAITIIAMLYLSPVSWQHQLTMLLLPCALIIVKLRNNQFKHHIVVFLLALILFSIPYIQIAQYLMALYAPYRMMWYTATIFLAVDIGMLMIWILLFKFQDRPPIPI